MKVALSSSGRDLNSQIDPRFGRCAYFLVINPDDMRFDVFDNKSSVLGGGAGIQAAQFLASKSVDAVITGNCGPNAVQTLSAAGIELFTGQSGIVKEVVERFKKGLLRPTNEATVDSHFGMAPGGGSGPGGSMRSGGGMRQGMGGGRGRGPGTGGIRSTDKDDALSGQRTTIKKGSGSASNDSELETLKKKADDINKQLEGIITRIHKLELGD